MVPARRMAARRRPVLAALLAAAALAAACGESTGPRQSAEVTVMTRNLYLGADIFRVMDAGSAQEIPVVVSTIFQIVQSNDFPARAGALAAEIQATNPDLIGLQEVTLYRTQTPSDYITGTTEPNATEVFIDFLEVLLDSLDARGLDYRVASEVVNADVEMPAAVSATEFFDVRMTDRDVILARSDVQTSNAFAGAFQIIVPFELPTGDTIWFERGYTSVDAMVDGVDFVFVNTHLEVSGGGQLEQVQTMQAAELIQRYSGEPRVVAVGDFNTGPGDGPYQLLAGSFTDAWTALGTGDPGLTCCFPEFLSQTSDLYSRIDLILYRGDIQALSAQVVGDDPADRTPGGLWPSDHAGVVATLRINR
jgi:endonuclease/exonuclease/phosphatase family metal-dependent hydrolase